MVAAIRRRRDRTRRLSSLRLTRSANKAQLTRFNEHSRHDDVARIVGYRWLLDQRDKAEHIVAAGESAGAILTVGVLQRAPEGGLAQPAAAMIMSGWFDLAATGVSFVTNG